MDKVFVPYLVYKNVLLMMEKYRHLKNVGAQIPEDEFRKEIQFNGAITIKAIHESKPDKVFYIGIMGIVSKYTESTAGFKRYVDEIMRKNKDFHAKKSADMIIISPEPLTTHIKKKIRDLTNEKLRILEYGYDVFKLEIPRHKLNDPHELVSIEDRDLIIEDTCAELHNFAKLRAHKDPLAIWYGFEPGDFVRVHAISETAGKKIIYKYVI